MTKYDGRRDFNGSTRLLLVASLAALVGALSTVVAALLLHAIALFTNLFFYQRWSMAAVSPAEHTLGAG